MEKSIAVGGKLEQVRCDKECVCAIIRAGEGGWTWRGVAG